MCTGVLISLFVAVLAVAVEVPAPCSNKHPWCRYIQSEERGSMVHESAIEGI
jgi:hypothetical protein